MDIAQLKLMQTSLKFAFYRSLEDVSLEHGVSMIIDNKETFKIIID